MTDKTQGRNTVLVNGKAYERKYILSVCAQRVEAVGKYGNMSRGRLLRELLSNPNSVERDVVVKLLDIRRDEGHPIGRRLFLRMRGLRLS